jgi:hypothetical protein
MSGTEKGSGEGKAELPKGEEEETDDRTPEEGKLPQGVVCSGLK